MAEGPSGTVTFLFTDAEGSTRLWEADPAAMRVALERHDAILRESIAAHGGYVVKGRGDGLHAAFATVDAAAAAAIAAQSALRDEPWPPGATLRVRMGLHTGDAVERDGDYFGPAVNRAARIEALANGGQVLCSRATAELSGPEVPVRHLGQFRLRDVAVPQDVFQVGDGEFPPLRSASVVPTNLPAIRSELIGREDDVATISSLVGDEALVTLTGVGGVGKTRLALAVATEVTEQFGDGCWLVELAPVADGNEIPKVVAAAMGAGATDQGELVRHLADRAVLIVLDNCEHLIDHAADFVGSLLEETTGVRVLSTSREPLAVDGEVVRRVASLPLPPVEASLDDLKMTPAVQLFVRRAKAAAEEFELSADNARAVADICMHLDGIPLAIELAAARVRAMPPDVIAARLDERFQILGGGSRRGQERHRTLLAAVGWSHDLLGDDERVVFRRLGIFPASFDLGAAESVAAAESVDTLSCLVRLVERSLVQFDADSGRYRLLETLRQYAADQMAAAGETAAVRERHARWYLDLAARLAPDLVGPGFFIAESQLETEIDNLRTAADWCVTGSHWRDLLALCGNTHAFTRSAAALDGAAWYEQAVAHSDEFGRQEVVDALGELGYIVGGQLGNLAHADELVVRSHAIADAEHLDRSVWALLAEGVVLSLSGDFAASVEVDRRAAAIADVRGERDVGVHARGTLATALAALGEDDEARTTALEALQLAEEAGSSHLVAIALVTTSASIGAGAGTPDCRAAVSLLERYRGLPFARHDEMWMHSAWSSNLEGCGDPGWVEHSIEATRLADQLGALHVLEHELHMLALYLSESGNADAAMMLLGYCDANLRQHRMEGPLWARVRDRIGAALAEASVARGDGVEDARIRGARMSRGELRALLTQALTPVLADPS